MSDKQLTMAMSQTFPSVRNLDFVVMAHWVRTTMLHSCYHRLVAGPKGAEQINLLIHHHTHCMTRFTGLYSMKIIMMTAHLLPDWFFLPSGQTVREVLLVHSEWVLGYVSVK